MDSTLEQPMGRMDELRALTPARAMRVDRCYALSAYTACVRTPFTVFVVSSSQVELRSHCCMAALEAKRSRVGPPTAGEASCGACLLPLGIAAPGRPWRRSEVLGGLVHVVSPFMDPLAATVEASVLVERLELEASLLRPC